MQLCYLLSIGVTTMKMNTIDVIQHVDAVAMFGDFEIEFN